MKKVISVATTAAMTLSALAVPAVICAAEQEDGAIQQAAYAIEDAKIAQGTGSFDVVVRATRTGNVQAGSLDIETVLYYGGKFKANVTAVKSDVDGLNPSVDGNKVTIEGTGSVTKGDVVAVITVSIDKATPQNAVFSFTVQEADGDFASLKDSVAFLSVIEKSDKADAASIVLDSKNVFVATTEVEIPVTLSGTYGTLVTKFGASNDAVIKSIEIAAKYDGIIKKTDDGQGIAYLPEKLSEGTEITVDNEVVATLKVALPENVVSGQSFKVSTRYFDGSNSTDTAVTPDASKSSDADIIYVMKGDADLNNKVDQQDSVVLLKEVLYRDAKDEYLDKAWAKDEIDQTDEVAYTLKTLGKEALIVAAYEALDSDNGIESLEPSAADELDADGKKVVFVDATDCSIMLKYILERDARSTNGVITGEEDFHYADYLAELAAAK